MNPERDAIWSFETDRFFVGLYAEPEDLDPADTFEFPEDIEAVRNGSVEWFNAVVRVYHKNGVSPYQWPQVGFDSLGACAYKTLAEFYTSHRDPDPMNRNCSIMRAARGSNVCICHYFPDMVREAIADARRNISGMRLSRVA